MNEEIKPYSKNAKKHPEKQLKQIAASLREFGWRQPIVVDKNNEIIVGHGRWAAYQKYPNGIKEPWITKADDLTDEQVKAYRLADNKLNESEWDMGLAIEELRELSIKELSFTGFDEDIIINIDEDNFDAQAEYRKITNPVIQLGDLYQLGQHRLLCGDSTIKSSYEILLGQEKADMVFTDPPYNVNYNYTGIYKKGRKSNLGEVRFSDNKTDIDSIKFIENVFTNLYNYTKDTCPFYQWLASKNENLVRQGTENSGWYISQTIIWLKDRMVFSIGQDYHRVYEPCYFGWKKGKKHFVNKKGHGSEKEFLLLDKQSFAEWLDVLFEKKDRILDYVHPTQKPIKLAERAIKYHSRPHDIILEPFNGSGSTMLAAEQLKRKCYAIELDPKYVEVAIKRYVNFTGNENIKKNGKDIIWKKIP